MHKKVTVQIVTYNSAGDILQCIDSIDKQTYKNIELIIIDNKSTDNTVDLLKSNFPGIQLIENNENLGFCSAHNIGLKRGIGTYHLILNPDVILDSHFIENMVSFTEKQPQVGLATGKILRMMPNGDLSNIIDSTGILLPKNRRAYDRGQGKEDLGQYDKDRQVFGVCGAAAFYRKKMLEEIKIDGEYFDETFFAYKEDVDLSWRARNLGWKSIYVPEAIAYHKRGWQEEGRNHIPTFLKVHSLKNRYLMMLKNEKTSDFLKNLPFILSFDIAVFFYCLVKEPKTLKYIPSTLKRLYDTIKKRKKIQKKIKSKA